MASKQFSLIEQVMAVGGCGTEGQESPVCVTMI